MKKKFLKALMLMILIIPCMVVFSACGGNKNKTDNKAVDQDSTPSVVPQVELSNIKVDLSDDGAGFDYDEETKTFKFEYGSEIAIDKEDFNVIATYSDDSMKIESDYQLDLSSVSETPDVGDYKIKVKFLQKEVEFNVNIYPKKIAKPTLQDNIVYTYFENNGRVSEREVEVSDFDEETMSYSEDSVLKASNAGVYYIKITPKSNYVWEDFETSETEECVCEWKINRAKVYMNSPETLEFSVDGETKSIIFKPVGTNQEFSKYFEIASGVTQASEVGEYEFVVKLKDEYIQNYEILEIEYNERNGDFEYNNNRTQITYYWEIV